MCHCHKPHKWDQAVYPQLRSSHFSQVIKTSLKITVNPRIIPSIECPCWLCNFGGCGLCRCCCYMSWSMHKLQGEPTHVVKHTVKTLQEEEKEEIVYTGVAAIIKPLWCQCDC